MDFSNTTNEPNSYRNHGYTDEVDDDSTIAHSISDHSDIDITDTQPDVKDGARQTQQINGNVLRVQPEVLRRKSSKK